LAGGIQHGPSSDRLQVSYGSTNAGADIPEWRLGGRWRRSRGDKSVLAFYDVEQDGARAGATNVHRQYRITRDQ
jgi:hypothetical protein